MALCMNKNVIIDEFRFKIGQLLQVVELDARENNGSTVQLNKVKNIKLHFQSHNETLEDLCYVEKELLIIAPDVCLRKYYTQITSRYREVLPKESSLYITHSDETKLRIPTLRVESFYISILLHKYYHFLENKERLLAQYKLLFIGLLLAMFVVSVVAFLFSVLTQSSGMNTKMFLFTNSAMFVIAMICSGYFGAVISIVQRIQSISEKSVDGIDREDLLLKLANGKWGICLSIILGTLSPFVLLILIIIFQGISIKGASSDISFLPTLINFATPENYTGTVMSIFYGLRFATIRDLAEFILLSIACGFSERFIPDVLDRVNKELDKKIQETPRTSA